MAGLDKILSQITAESDAAINEILSKAEKEAADIKAQAEKEANEAVEKINRESASRLSDQKSRAESAAALAKRQMLLGEKQKLIGEVIDKAKESFLNLSDKEYFDTLIKLVKNNALPQDGEIIFNEKDLKRLPSDFSSKVQAAAAERKGTLKVSNETRPIDGGFVLAYNGIEENCSISALFETNVEELQDKIQTLLFKQ